MDQQIRNLSLAFVLLTLASLNGALAGGFRLWSELSSQEQAALAPIAADWNHLPTSQQEKLLKVAKGFAKLSPTQQQVLHRRLPSWTRMSSEQRSIARQNYQKLMELPQARQVQIKRRWQEARSPVLPGDSAPNSLGAAPSAEPMPATPSQVQ